MNTTIKITKESYQVDRACIKIAPSSKGYFLVQNELNHLLILPLRAMGVEIPSRTEPEKSVGIRWSAYLKKNYILKDGDRQLCKQFVNKNRGIQPFEYSNHLLGLFRHFFYEVYLMGKGYDYFKNIDPKLLPAIDRIIMMYSSNTMAS